MKAKRWTLRLLKVAVAAALLTFVATSLSWSDRAIALGHEGAAGLEGKILAAEEGEGARPWRAARVRFRFDASAPAAGEFTALVEDDPAARILDREGWRLQPGFPTLVAHMRLGIYLVAALLFFAGICISIVRWHLLLRSAGVLFSFHECFRLTFIGLFFNTVVPGLTGGDLVKAFLVARRTDKRAAAVVSVFVDRLLGLFALTLLAAIAALFLLSAHPEVALGILGFFGLIVVGSALFFSHRVRALLHLDAILNRLPGGNLLRTVDEAFFLYRYRLRTVGFSLLLSLANHLLVISGVFMIGMAIAGVDERATLFDLLVIYPVVGIASSVPITPAGLGVGEALFGTFFREFGHSYDVGVLTSFLYRITYIGWSLLGGLFLALGHERVRSAEIEKEWSNAPPSSAESSAGADSSVGTAPPPG